MLEKIKGYKTIAWAVWPTFIIMLVNTGVVGPEFKGWAEELATQYWEAIVMFYGAGVLGLRAITNTGIFKKE